MQQMSIANAAGNLLYIRFQMINRGVEFHVALAGEFSQFMHQPVFMASIELCQRLGQLSINLAVSEHLPRIEQTYMQLDVPLVHARTLGYRAHRLAHAQSAIPQLPQKFAE